MKFSLCFRNILLCVKKGDHKYIKERAIKQNTVNPLYIDNLHYTSFPVAV